MRFEKRETCLDDVSWRTDGRRDGTGGETCREMAVDVVLEVSALQ